MKRIAILAAAVLVAAATPALSRDAVAAQPVARPNVAGPIAIDPPGPNFNEINRKIHARAKNAVANGADPAVVRQKVKEYKQQLRRRYNASQ